MNTKNIIKKMEYDFKGNERSYEDLQFKFFLARSFSNDFDKDS